MEITITKDFDDQINDHIIFYVEWENPDIDVDLSRFTGKKICVVKGTFNQIVSLSKYASIVNIKVCGAVNVQQVPILKRLLIKRRDCKPRLTVFELDKNVHSRVHVEVDITYCTDINSIRKSLKYCSWVYLNTYKFKDENLKEVLDLFIKYAKYVKRITFGYATPLDYIVSFIKEASNLLDLKCFEANQNIVDVVGKSDIRIVELRGDSFNISSILSNPMICLFKTNADCTYSGDIKIEYFVHKNKSKYEDIRKQCAINRKKNKLEKLANIKTPC